MAATVSDEGGPAAATMMPRTPELEEEGKENDSANLGGPSPKCRSLIPYLRIARTKNFFDTQLPQTTWVGWFKQQITVLLQMALGQERTWTSSCSASPSYIIL